MENDNQESLEALRVIASDHDVSYDDTVTAQDLVEKIMLATQKEMGDGSI
ncbi:MAG: hypothetical protein JW816_00820 [Candidatus Buchananbacteria bacterium]|nr:hypothetical protein [Candidatus Buchananbacteria bacterium]